MVRLGDFEVIVNSPDIGALPEFDDPDAAAILQKINGRGIVKYVQATADTVFSFAFTILPEHDIEATKDINFFVSRDGKAAIEGVLLRNDTTGHNGSSSIYEGRSFVAWGQRWKLERFCFGPLHLTDDVAADMQQDQVSAVGTLRIEVWEYKRTRKRKPRIGAATTEKRDIFSEGDFKESSSDLLVNMDYPESGKPVTSYDGKFIGDAPQATFILKYRSREALQILGLIPRSPSPIPLERRDIDSLTIEEVRARLRQAERDIDSLNIEEVRQRLRQAAENNQAAAVKAEEQNDTKQGIKREASALPPEMPVRKRLATGDGGIDNDATRGDEVITLSDSE